MPPIMEQILQIIALVLMGSAAAIGGAASGYHLGDRLGLDPGYGAIAGVIAGMAGFVPWLVPS